jgi:hypothetical protein
VFNYPIEQVSEGEEVEHDRMVNMAAEWHRVEVGVNRKRVAPACGARIRREPVKRVRIAHCSLS